MKRLIKLTNHRAENIDNKMSITNFNDFNINEAEHEFNPNEAAER